MSESVTCDGCQQTAEQNGLVGWLVVEPYGISTQRLDEDPGPWHFHNRSCLGAWVARLSA